MSLRAYSSIVGMSCRDFLHEGKLSICAVIGVAAVLTPLLVLFGLKFGIVSSLLQTLSQDPRARALQPIGQGQYGDAFFKTLGDRPEVGFLLPNTRFLAATVILSNKDGDRSLNAEFLPSGPGDPLLPTGVT